MVPDLFGFIPRLDGAVVQVTCEQGVVHMFNFPLPVIYHYITVIPHGGKKRTEKAYLFPPGSLAKGEEWWSTYRYQLEAFVDKVRGRIPQTWVSGEDSIQNMFWIEKIYEEVCMSQCGAILISSCTEENSDWPRLPPPGPIPASCRWLTNCTVLLETCCRPPWFLLDNTTAFVC